MAVVVCMEPCAVYAPEDWRWLVPVFLVEHKEKETWNQKQWEDLLLKVQSVLVGG